jgi:hypothetical protein
VAVLEISEIQDKVLETVRTSQDSVADAVKGITAKLPSLPSPEQLPKPAEIAELAFGLATQVVEVQRSFVNKVVGSLPLGGPSA